MNRLYRRPPDFSLACACDNLHSPRTRLLTRFAKPAFKRPNDATGYQVVNLSVLNLTLAYRGQPCIDTLAAKWPGRPHNADVMSNHLRNEGHLLDFQMITICPRETLSPYRHVQLIPYLHLRPCDADFASDERVGPKNEEHLFLFRRSRCATAVNPVPALRSQTIR